MVNYSTSPPTNYSEVDQFTQNSLYFSFDMFSCNALISIMQLPMLQLMEGSPSGARLDTPDLRGKEDD